MSKKEIIARLVALGVVFDETLSATELKVILKKAEEDKAIADKAALDLVNKDIQPEKTDIDNENIDTENKEPIKEEEKKEDIITIKEEVKDIKDMTYEELLVKCQDFQVMPIYEGIGQKGGYQYTIKEDSTKLFNSVYEAAVYNLFLKLKNEG